MGKKTKPKMAKKKPTKPTINPLNTSKIVTLNADGKIGAKTEVKIASFLKVFLEKGCNISVACAAANIHRCTYYDWLQKYPEFGKAINTIREGLIDHIETHLLSQSQEGNFQATRFLLLNIARHRGWQDVKRIEAKINERIEIVHKYGKSEKRKKTDSSQT